MNRNRGFTSTPDAVAQARRFATGQLLDLPADIVERVGLMVSELATNCIRHAATEFTVDIEQTAYAVRVRVTDRGRGEPHVQSPTPTELSGRGLLIVQQLSDEFGVDYAETADATGKTVWFVVNLEESTAKSAARHRAEPLRSSAATNPFTATDPDASRHAPEPPQWRSLSRQRWCGSHRKAHRVLATRS